MTGHPTVDIVTDKVAVVLQQRQVVPMSSWIADAVRACSETGHGLQIVTPEHARLTAPLRLVLTHGDSRWVIRTADGHYDGLSGTPLEWHGDAFEPVTGATTPAAPFTRNPHTVLAPRLTVTLRIAHPAEATTILGGALDQLTRALTGAPPSGWGTSEPATRPWRRDELTALCRDRAPRPTWLMYVGHGDRPAVGTIAVSCTESGVEESIAVIIGYQPDEPAPYPVLEDAVAELTGAHLLIRLFAQVEAGPEDLTTTPHSTGTPIPIGLAIGPDGVREAGFDRAHAPPGLTPRPIGGTYDPAIWYPLNEGDPQQAWARYERLGRYLFSR